MNEVFHDGETVQDDSAYCLAGLKIIYKYQNGQKITFEQLKVYLKYDNKSKSMNLNDDFVLLSHP